MPELPEVETIRSGIEPYLVGNNIQHVIVRNARLRWTVSEQILTLNNQQVHSVQRRAKYLLIELKRGWIVAHMGISGSIRVLSEKKQDIIGKHDHIDIIISNGIILRYNDPRRFGSWVWCENLATHNTLAHLGPEPLSETFNAAYLYNKSRNMRSQQIKPWLMDNKVVAGIGNIYANESLFSAKISPNLQTNLLSKKQAEVLVETIKLILARSIKKKELHCVILYNQITIRDISVRSCKYMAEQVNSAIPAGCP